jgi:hypothetical protein
MSLTALFLSHVGLGLMDIRPNQLRVRIRCWVKHIIIHFFRVLLFVETTLEY